MATLESVPLRATPNDSLVRVLEELLADAKACKGETLYGIIFNNDGTYTIVCSAAVGKLKKIGALHAIQHELLAE